VAPSSFSLVDEHLERYYEAHYGRRVGGAAGSLGDVDVAGCADAFYRTLVDACRPLVTRESRVIDIGCSLGRVIGEIARLGVSRAVGVDSDPAAIREASRILRAREPVPIAGGDSIDLAWGLDELELEVGDALDLKFANESFDLALSLNLLDRVADPRLAVSEMKRVLARGAHAVVTCPMHWDPSFTPREQWIRDLSELLCAPAWRITDTTEAIRFAIRPHARRVVLYDVQFMIAQRLG
jgi:SAM-dependent methyltransferase